MLERIAQITGRRYDPSNVNVMAALNAIARDLPENVVEDNEVFPALVLAADSGVEVVGNQVMANMFKTITAPKPERVLLIKSSPKGARIKEAASNGIRYSFGPIWNVSVTKGKGIALAEANREKLNHQGLMVGVKNPEKMEARALAAAIAATF